MYAMYLRQHAKLIKKQYTSTLSDVEISAPNLRKRLWIEIYKQES